MKISIFHATAGHGHKKVAEVIAKGFKDQGLDPNELKVEDALEKTSPVFRMTYPASYFYSVKYFPGFWGWGYETLDNPLLYALIKPVRQWVNSFEGRALLKSVIEDQPDCILCTHFFSAELFARAKKEGKIKSRLGVVITDFYPHTFWLNEGTDFYWVMSDESKAALVKRGIPESKVIAGGIPADSIFKPTGRKRELLKQYGFAENKLTILLTSGSFGLAPQDEILKSLNEFKDRIQCFVVCGNNQALHKKLDAQKFDFPVRIFGFVNFMADLMEASDLLIAKSGGATTVESLVKEIPMVVFQPIPGQEMRNAKMLKDYNASFFMQEPEQAKLIVKAILDQPAILEQKRMGMKLLAKPSATEDLVQYVFKQIKS